MIYKILQLLKMSSKNLQIIFLIIFIFVFINKRAQSDLRDKYTIISEMQSHNSDSFEAIGNVKIIGENNFSASSDKLLYEKKNSKLNLIGNVKVNNYETDNILIENITSDDLIIFLENGEIKVHSENGNKVKTYLKFLKNQ